MQTRKTVNQEIYVLSTTYFIKYNLLSDVIYGRKEATEIKNILYARGRNSEFESIMDKIQKLKDRVENESDRSKVNFKKISDLRKKGKDLIDQNRLDEGRNYTHKAYQNIFPLIESGTSDVRTQITFGWVMYNYLKVEEENIVSYVKSLKQLNDYITFPIVHKEPLYQDRGERILISAVFWSISKQLLSQTEKINSIQEKKGAGKLLQQGRTNKEDLLQQIFRFIPVDTNLNAFLGHQDEENDSVRYLIRTMMDSLDDDRYLQFTDALGFDWFQPTDYEKKVSGTTEYQPLAERILGHHAKKLEELEVNRVTPERVYKFIDKLKEVYEEHPEFEYLPYYQAKLHRKMNQKEDALLAIVAFARRKVREYWVWTFIASIVEGDAKFNALSMSLIVDNKHPKHVQAQLIPLLVEREMFSSSKYEVNCLSNVLTEKDEKLLKLVEQYKQEDWYKNAEMDNDREKLDPYAEAARKILAVDLQYYPILTSFVNIPKQTVHFYYALKSNRFREGYFYMDAAPNGINWKEDQVIVAQMSRVDEGKPLFTIYDTYKADDDIIALFIKKESGIVNKKSDNPFAFVNDIYIHPRLVKEYDLQNGKTITYNKKPSLNKDQWGWAVLEVL